MPSIDSKGVKIYYEDTGSGTPIVFVHGLGIDRRIFKYQIDALKEKFRLITFDLRGHGKSEAPETGYSYNYFADDLKNLIEHLALKDFHLVGLSLGGAVAVRYQIENPEKAKSLTLIGSHIVGYMKFQDWPNMFKIARKEGVEKARETWKNFRLFENLKDAKEKFDILTDMVNDFSCAYWLDPDPRYDEPNDLKRLDQIEIPVLLAAGKDDQDFYPIAELARVELPNSKFIEFDSGHLVSFEKPDEFNNVLLKFIEEID
ncbi:MAG TPA: alpha/beta hydrolase [candidate division Zixibacteria bacterium]|nr:alpha/beta hydrolase [candidate division Zixibacteria bacterium]HER00065.1 alpha/beta hydrolase [candidate division Zixibacteria bacterium]